MDGRDRRLFDFAYEVGRADDLDEFRLGVTRGIAGLVGCDLASYTEVDLASQEALALIDQPVDLSDDLAQELGRLAHQHPLITLSDGHAEAISDFLSAARFHALELYSCVYGPLGAEDQIAIRLSAAGGCTVVGVALNRATRGFSDVDRATLDQLRPVLVRSYQRALARERGRELLAQLNDAPENGRAGVLAVSAQGRVEFASDHARRWLSTYFGVPCGSAVPALVSDWLASPVCGDAGPLIVAGEHGRLEVWRTLVSEGKTSLLELHEHRRAPPVEELTGRERQVAARAATGESNDELARALGISRRTVESHLRSIYRKLGVSNRTAATAALRE